MKLAIDTMAYKYILHTPGIHLSARWNFDQEVELCEGGVMDRLIMDVVINRFIGYRDVDLADFRMID